MAVQFPFPLPSPPWLWWVVVLAPVIDLVLTTFAHTTPMLALLSAPATIASALALFVLLQNAPLAASLAVMASPFLAYGASSLVSSWLLPPANFLHWLSLGTRVPGLILGGASAATWRIASKAPTSTRIFLAIAVPVAFFLVVERRVGLLNLSGGGRDPVPRPTQKPTTGPPATTPPLEDDDEE